MTKSSTHVYPKKERAYEGSPFLKSGLCKWALPGVMLGLERGYRFGIGHECHHFCKMILSQCEIFKIHPKIGEAVKNYLVETCRVFLRLNLKFKNLSRVKYLTNSMSEGVYTCPNGLLHFLSTSKWAISCLRTLSRVVCALFSSIRQCQKARKQGYTFANLRIVYLTHILTAGYNEVLKSVTQCPFDRGRGGTVS